MERQITKRTGRRDFLKSSLAASAYVVAGSSLPRQGFAAESKTSRRFFPVKISHERIIRTVIGLRPYRSQGFVLRAERLGEKVLIHNYGHGGSGVTLSWGVATLAVELARDIEQHNVAVIGCGVIGLSTARMLQRRGRAVTIYARELPPETTSNVSGALWYPTSIYNPQKVSPQFLEQFQLACRISQRAFQTLVGTEYGVRWMETFDLQRESAPLERVLPGGAQLYPETRIHKDAKHYFGFPFVRQFNTMMIEPSVYLPALLRDFHIAGGKVVVRELRSREEIAALPEPVVFNCTGLGAKTLFDDAVLIPVRGQLEVLLPQPEIDYCYLSNSSYMFPRRDGIILGGTFEHDKWSLAPETELTTRIIEANAEIMKGLRR
ncbi:MAG TPA: FAD-dependent oxidoreductase [Pyrinomonadaceae bacterium]|jgi:glycine/D-amino acid oxidase-like deaminating enzyme|nr:FAD-dependent oxidoreductase [Pyrinomonadaceae bacterium]